jgi:phospholipase C
MSSISTSIRESLNAVGQSISIKEWAKQNDEDNYVFPLSLRQLVHAPIPGHVLQKVISLDLLQSKFNTFFNQRSQPLFQIRLDGKKPGESTVTIAQDDPITRTYNHDQPFTSIPLAGPGEQLEADFGILGNHRIHFSDVRSDEITLDIVLEPRLGINVFIHFETEGIDLRVQGLPDIDFTIFKIRLKMEFDSTDGLISLLGWVDDIEAAAKSIELHSIGAFKYKFREQVAYFSYPYQLPSSIEPVKDYLKHKLATEFISVDVSVDVNNLPDGVVADGVMSTIASKLFDGLDNPNNRRALNRIATRWLMGGDFYVARISSDNGPLTIDFIVPPGQLEPFPESPQSSLDPGSLANIDHIVVLMMENRSFDHMLGHLSKEGHADGTVRTDVDGLHGGEKNPFLGQDVFSFPLPNTQFLCNPPQDHRAVENQVNNGKMDGFVAEFARQAASDECAGLGAEPGLIMGYHRADHVPVYDALAHEFLVCQRWFAAHPGPTFPNRFYTLTGRLNRDSFGNSEVDNFHGDDFRPVDTKTIFDHLNDHGVSWRYYEHDYSFIRMFARYTTDNANVVSAGPDSVNFVNDVLAGNLSPVTFIDPDFIDIPPGSDDEPPSDIAAGQHFVGRVVDAVIHGPLWNKTLLIITYDEHGGFFDHVNPPKAIAVSADIDSYGVRVPAFVVSPWVDRGKVSDIVFDHTSIAKTIARRFMSENPPDMGERMTGANDVSMVLSSTMRTDTPSIPVPPAPPIISALSSLAKQRIADNQGFKAALRTMRSRYPMHV